MLISEAWVPEGFESFFGFWTWIPELSIVYYSIPIFIGNFAKIWKSKRINEQSFCWCRLMTICRQTAVVYWYQHTLRVKNSKKVQFLGKSQRIKLTCLKFLQYRGSDFYWTIFLFVGHCGNCVWRRRSLGFEKPFEIWAITFPAVALMTTLARMTNVTFSPGQLINELSP